MTKMTPTTPSPISDQAAGSWKLVPIAPTPDMAKAGMDQWYKTFTQHDLYVAMVNAAPTAPTTGSAPALCAICKGYGRYQDGDSGTELDGYAPNIVECECAPEERIDANFDVIVLTDDHQRTIEHAATKLENISHIFAGDKESRRLASELKALLAASMGENKS